MPNVPETVIAMLAAASLGAIWSSCSPDFGVKGVLDRFSQIAPSVLVCADGYAYAGKEIDSLGRVRDIADAIPSVRRVVVVPFRRRAERGEGPSLAGIRDALTWDAFVAPHAGAELAFVRLPFDHPLYIMYSSGTTGLPKCMVHSAGGTLAQHLKEHQLHCDIGPGDRVFYFTTCGWMMWNWLASALASEATIVLYDGAAMPPGAPGALWTMAQEERITVFGTSAKYLALCEKEGLVPAASHDFPALRAILSTGSPLAPASFDWVYRAVKRDVHLASISGGTDIISCFVGGVPTAPVWRGEIQGPALGMRVDVFDERGCPAPVGEQGELVCTMPFPSMPVAFWNDPDGTRLREAYFETFPGVWRHGDWIKIDPDGACVIYGRSDSTLNRGGVRMGTAEFYRVVEELPGVADSLIIDTSAAGAEGKLLLYVVLEEGVALGDVRDKLRAAIRANLSPRHVPDEIVAIPEVPRTLNGKKCEVPVKRVLAGVPVEQAASLGALKNPESLAPFLPA
jgi:acetoacetyl-CoA synthetase